jgi:phenylpropionate dioxygenase-like ring-hydroxylating dioxygenase large terminal subunit/putative sterol carrier protein
VARFPFPCFPTGWFAVAFSPDIAPGEVKTLHYFDRDIVLFRSQSGVVSALDKTCPHLGAHLGGGQVEGDCLRCPFHGWAFDVEGRCVDVPYAPKIPPRARVEKWPTLEQDGVVFVHHDAAGRAPRWTPPPLDLGGWTKNRTIRWEIRSHPQEVGENTVDCTHLGPVHHVIATDIREVEQRAHFMRVLLHMVATGHVIGMPADVNDVELDVTLHGLGHIVSRTHVTSAGLRTLQRIHPTPIDAERIAIFAVGNTMEMPDPAYTAEIDEIFWEAFTKDFARDFPIWENKAYLERPLLAGGDGPIGSYRRWARQFYPVSAKQTAAPADDGVEEPAGRTVARLFGSVRDALLRKARATAAPERVAAPVRAAKVPPRRQHRFESVDAYFDTLERRFDAGAAGELEAVFQWKLSGDRSVDHFAEVKDGTIRAASGRHATPTVVIEMSAEDYLRMINGDLNGAIAFSTGRGRLRGPVRLAMRMQQLFPLDRAV